MAPRGKDPSTSSGSASASISRWRTSTAASSLRLEAARDKLRETFAAKVHAARAEVGEALRDPPGAGAPGAALRGRRSRPALDENAQLTDAALELGDVNVLQFVTAQSKVLKGRREVIEARLDYWKAVFDLERALGSRIDEVEGREE